MAPSSSSRSGASARAAIASCPAGRVWWPYFSSRLGLRVTRSGQEDPTLTHPPERSGALGNVRYYARRETDRVRPPRENFDIVLIRSAEMSGPQRKPSAKGSPLSRLHALGGERPQLRQRRLGCGPGPINGLYCLATVNSALRSASSTHRSYSPAEGSACFGCCSQVRRAVSTARPNATGRSTTGPLTPTAFAGKRGAHRALLDAAVGRNSRRPYWRSAGQRRAPRWP
jgi:hypothetical protein